MTVTSDLLICLVSIAVFSAGLFIVGLRIGRRGSRILSGLVAALAAAGLAMYAVWLNESPLLTHLLPIANVLLWGNIMLPAAALLGGVAWSSLKTPVWQRAVLVVSLLVIGIWREAGPLIGRPPPVGPERWTYGVCRQTSTSSCSAAAAVTLLADFGIRASEAEMIDVCLTHVEGTSTLGLYRGLMLKTAGTPWTVLADAPLASDLSKWPLPAEITVSLPGLKTSVLGMGVGHSLVVERLEEDGTYEILDPFVGRQHWTRQQLMDAYGGDLMTLVPRRQSATPH